MRPSRFARVRRWFVCNAWFVHFMRYLDAKYSVIYTPENLKICGQFLYLAVRNALLKDAQIVFQFKSLVRANRPKHLAMSELETSCSHFLPYFVEKYVRLKHRRVSAVRFVPKGVTLPIHQRVDAAKKVAAAKAILKKHGFTFAKQSDT